MAKLKRGFFSICKITAADLETSGSACEKGRLSGAEADEFFQLYQRTAADLAFLRANAPDPELIMHLSAILGRARSKLTAQQTSVFGALQKLFFVTLPYAFYRIRWWIFTTTLCCIMLFAIVLLTYLLNPQLIENLAPKDQLDYYAKVGFEAYYSAHPNSDFTLIVWTNNAWIALQCIASGVTGIYPLYVLWANTISVGQAGAVLASRDLLSEFFQLILPHGQLELFAIFIAGAAGLRLFGHGYAPEHAPHAGAR
ncbi:stage II sporulation protein M [Arcanobacterium hippocoleae]|uniref:stage II sporulation protein M n=1 Tax=Arcanobacterium hippocoleae TaxID=149017 RepID=UPI00334149E8